MLNALGDIADDDEYARSGLWAGGRAERIVCVGLWCDVARCVEP